MSVCSAHHEGRSATSSHSALTSYHVIETALIHDSLPVYRYVWCPKAAQTHQPAGMLSLHKYFCRTPCANLHRVVGFGAGGGPGAHLLPQFSHERVARVDLQRLLPLHVALLVAGQRLHRRTRPLSHFPAWSGCRQGFDFQHLASPSCGMFALLASSLRRCGRPSVTQPLTAQAVTLSISN